MGEIKIVPEYIDRSFGFDVYIKDAPMKKVFGEWALALNHNKLRDAVLSGLVIQQGPLTGNQARCIRLAFNQRPSVFAEQCGVSEAAVLMWEARADELAQITPAVEQRVRGLAFEALPQEAQHLLFEKLFGVMLERMSLTQAAIATAKALWSAVRAPKSQDPFHPTPELLTA